MGTRICSLWTGPKLAGLAAALVLVIPAAATADNDAARGASSAPIAGAAVPKSLLDAARANPKGRFGVVVRGEDGKSSKRLAARIGRGLVKAQFTSIDGLTASLPGKTILWLAHQSDVVAITPDAVVVPEGKSNSQHWAGSIGLPAFWSSPSGGKAAPTIAFVDSGIDNSSGTFGNRLLASVDLGRGKSGGDDRGHGTFVAGIAAGAAAGLTGVAPTASLVALDVFDSQGRTKISNVIQAADWILANKDKYGIRVANFSLTTSVKSSFMYDPLDQAVEKLWESGVVVVAAAGNYASEGKPSGVLYAPANDPFVITVGAADVHGTTAQSDDSNAPWSAYGYTPDGFSKPDVGAPGRYIVEKVPAGATLASAMPTNVLRPGLMQLSGTSFAAPVVSGMAADLLAVHPDWTPDQVKGALMLSAVGLRSAAARSEGVGEVNLIRALHVSDPPNPNLALERFLEPDPAGGPLPVFAADKWKQVAASNPSWDAASWSPDGWTSAAWSSASWTSASWTAASWTSASWTSASWTSAASTPSSVPDNAGDGQGRG